MKINFVSLICFFVTSVGFASQNLNLHTQEGAAIQLEYTLVEESSNSNKPTGYNFAQPLEFLVRIPGAGSTDKLRIVLINREKFRDFCASSNFERSPHYVVDLSFDSHRQIFVGSFDRAKLLMDGVEVPLSPTDQRLQLRVNGYCNSVATTQELALVVNGVWQTDPVTQTHNFRFNLLYP